MLKELKREANMTLTENGAITYKTTNSDCLDLFASIGAIRRETDEEIIRRFVRAYTENKDIAIKLMFFARDIRGGLGERRVFRVILKYLAENEAATVVKNLEYIAEYGRFDDLLVLMGTPCEGKMLEYIEKQLLCDIEAMEKGREVSLLAKWLPSVNASNKETVQSAKEIARFLRIDDRQYRKMLVRLRKHIKIIENNLRERDYTFDYEKQPSKAMYKYRKAFIRNDRERYEGFIQAVKAGEKVLNAETLAPYELTEPYLYGGSIWAEHCFMKKITREEKNTLNATWASLPGYESDENVLAVIDTSGSMYGGGRPLSAAVALSLGLYFAEHNTGAFKNHFIEFSKKPELIEIKGETFADRLRYVATFNDIADTNLEAVFDLVLRAAVKNKVAEEDIPKKLIIISDMEFNRCVVNAEMTIFENAKARFNACGYRLPEIVFWNVASRNDNMPVTKNEQGVILVSGCTPRLFSMVANGDISSETPYAFMLEVVQSERYERISA